MQGVEDLWKGDRVFTTNVEKVETLSIVFFPKILALHVEDQRTIDVMWRTHRLPSTINGIGV